MFNSPLQRKPVSAVPAGEERGGRTLPSVPMPPGGPVQKMAIEEEPVQKQEAGPLPEEELPV